MTQMNKTSLMARALGISFLTVGCALAGPPANESPSPLNNPLVAATSDKEFLPVSSDGLVVQKWAQVPKARSLAVSPDGAYVFVGTQNDQVYRVKVKSDSGAPRQAEVFVRRLECPNGVTFSKNRLLVAERQRVVAYKNWNRPIDDESSEDPEIVIEQLPSERAHGWRYIKAGPNDDIRIAIGAPGNVCLRTDDPRFATICSFRPDGSQFKVVARGVRNSVGFDWVPADRPNPGAFFFSDNGRDNLGDDIPPCELNYLGPNESDVHFGFPYYWGYDQKDPDFATKKPADLKTRMPVFGFQAHVAPLGCHFPRHQIWRQSLQGRLLVAQHGSWNRSSKVGYQVVSVLLAPSAPGTQPIGSELRPFLDGFLDEKVHGRPVDIAELPDGTLLISDDHSGSIWSVRPSSPSL